MVAPPLGQDAERSEGGRAAGDGQGDRGVDIDAGGRMRIGVGVGVGVGAGATLVRHCDPDSEVAETRAKAAGLLASLSAALGAAAEAFATTGAGTGADADAATDAGAGAGPATDTATTSDARTDAGPVAGAPRPDTAVPARYRAHPRVVRALAERNEKIARFWFADGGPAGPRNPALDGRSVLVVGAEDTFTAMIAHQLRALGLRPTVRRFDEPHRFGRYDLVVLGPGPGDPRGLAHPKVARLDGCVRRLLHERLPFLAVCLSHQVLSARLGLDLVRRLVPNQGVQREVDLFGSVERVGFYNTFAARSAHDSFRAPGIGTVRAGHDPVTGEVHALRGPRFASMQFHAESVLTEDGVRITGDMLTEVLRCE